MQPHRALAHGTTLLLALVLARPAAADPRLADRVIARVDGRPILLSELRARARPLLARFREAPAWQRTAALRSALGDLLERRIREALVAQLAKRHAVSVTEAEVEAAIAEIARQSRLTREAVLAAALDAGFAEPEYRAELRRQLLERKVLLREADRRRERPPAGAEATAWWNALGERVLDQARRESCVERRARF